MSHRDAQHLADSLNAMVQQVEQSSGLGRDHPDVIELRRIVSRKISNLEAAITLDRSEQIDAQTSRKNLSAA